MLTVIGLLGIAGCAADRPDGPPIATLADFTLHLSSTPVQMGANKFVIHNEGGVEHEFIAFKIDKPVADLELTPEGNLNEDVLKNVTDGENLAPGTNDTRTVTITEPGTYLFVCNLPTHFKKGMWETVIVP